MKNQKIAKPIGIFLVLAMLAMLFPPNAFAAPAPSVTAASAVVIHAGTGEALYEKNADTLRVPASMTKLMTAYIIYEELAAGNITKDTLVPVSKNAADKSRSASYPMAVPLTRGASYSVDQLLKLILVPSASASCIVMAEYLSGSEAAFVERMNRTAASLGLTAEFKNSHGAQAHYTTARSIALLGARFIKDFPDVLNYTSMKSITFNGKTYANTNKLLGTYYYEGADGLKTGTITEAGYCLCATAVRDGQRIISVVMKSANDKSRHTDSTALLNYGFQVLEERARAEAAYYDTYKHWADNELKEVKNLGLIEGDGNNRFRPDDSISRAEYVTIVMRALERAGAVTVEEGAVSSFADVSGHWAEKYIAAAEKFDLISGYGDGIFAPNDKITREQMMVITDNGWQLEPKEAVSFTDIGTAGDWAKDAVCRAGAAGIASGYPDGSFRPLANTSRAEAAVILLRILAMELDFKL